MDINSLLSPQPSPDEEIPSGTNAPKPLRRTLSSALAPKPSLSVSRQSSSHSLVLPASTVSPVQQTLPSPPVVKMADGRMTSTVVTPSADVKPQSSTAGMDTLADLASMQHLQQMARTNSGGPRNPDVFDSQNLPTARDLQSISRTQARRSPRSSVDRRLSNRLNPTTQTKVYKSASLPESELAEIASLVTTVSENPYQYESHLRLVKLLRQGFLVHITPSESGTEVDPRQYELLEDLRQARTSLQSRLALGEDMWADWICDESVLARTIEQRVEVIELCRRAVAEEVGSVKLWLLYGNWVCSLYNAARPGFLGDLVSKYELDRGPLWTDEDKAVGAEVFTWDTMLDVWKQGVRATEWRVNDSHLIWDRYAELMLEEVANGPNHEKIGRIRATFEQRLRMPHAAWDQTFQTFSTFITNYSNESYEETMVNANKCAVDAKAKYALREPYEVKLRTAVDSADSQGEWAIFTEYVEWELAQARKKKDNFPLCSALFDRALLRFGTDTGLWEDYAFFLVDWRSTRDPSVSPLPALHRATRHCPWSGTLWSQYLLSSESEDKPFHEVEEVKHKATSTGLLDIGGMEEVLKAFIAWCGYLNRRAFHEKATDEEADVAEVGIRSTIESVRELGEKKHGKGYKGDPSYRLERIYVEYLSRSGLWDRARAEVWKTLLPTRGGSYEFWLRWYHWEMMYWHTTRANVRVSGAMSTPSSATAVLRQAVSRPNLDWPEKIIEVYLNHVEDFETVENLQAAALLARKISKSVAKRRQLEAAEAQKVALSQQQQSKVDGDVQPTEIEQSTTAKGKRKREPEVGTDPGSASKKSRQAEAPDKDTEMLDQPPEAANAPKRDREHATVIVKNLPADLPETRVRRLFRDCGQMNSIKLLPDPNGTTATATIEFETREDVLAALTKDMKTIEGNQIEVQVGTGTTLFVTNFPPTADEKYIRELFSKYGDIVDVRFPSLKFNTHRRFCYVQFRSSSQAYKATEVDGKELGDKLKLVAKLSDPERKQNRTGALYEGREVYVSNVDWSATEEELGDIFSKYGTVERVRIPKNVAGKSKGMAFVVFSSKDEAIAALDMNLTKFKSRILSVALSESNPAKRQASTIINSRRSTSESPSLSDGGNTQTTNGDRPGSQAPPEGQRPSRENIQSRTIALLNIPDTINDARIRALMEPYGPLVKIVLRPDHQGAIVEYADVKDAGKASLGVEGIEIVPGRRVTVGSVKDLFEQKAEIKTDKIKPVGAGTGGAGKKKGGSGADAGAKSSGGGGAGGTSNAALAMRQAGPIKRPTQPGPRRGGRGGLGLKNAGVGIRGPRGTTDADAAGAGAGPSTSSHESPESMDVDNPKPGPAQSGSAEAGAAGPPKTNADFKAMFLK